MGVSHCCRGSVTPFLARKFRLIMLRLLSVVAVSAIVSAAGAQAATGVCTTGETQGGKTSSVTSVLTNTSTDVYCGTNPDYSADPGGSIVEEFFGMDYTLSFKSDEAKGDGVVTFSDPMTQEENAPGLGSWALNTFAAGTSVLIGIKQGTLYGAFLVSSTRGDWYTKDGSTVTNKYSHVDIWYKTGDVPPVPLPAAGWMLLAGVAGMGAMRRRKKS